MEQLPIWMVNSHCQFLFPNDIILISYIGYMPLEMAASQVKGTKIFLKEDSKNVG